MKMLSKEQIVDLLQFIEFSSKQVSSEYSLPLYDRELELLAYKVEEYLESLSLS